MNHIIENGDELEIGAVGDFGSSITQGVTIIPAPGNTNLFYIFQLQYSESPINHGLKYSLVDMSLNAGLGSVIIKNAVLYDKQVTEKMQAVRHGNGRDWWLIIYAWPDYDLTMDSTLIFKKFLITDLGIQGPYDQSIGPGESLTMDRYTQGIGQMVFNYSGDIMANIRYNVIDIYTFNRCTGMYSDWIEIKNLPNKRFHGCSFSIDDAYLFISEVGDSPVIYSYELYDTANIESTQDTLWNSSASNYAIGSHLLLSNGDILISYLKSSPSPTINQNMYLSFIEIEDDFISVKIKDQELDSCYITFGLPNMPNYRLGELEGSECDTLSTAISENPKPALSFSIYPNPASNVLNIETVAQGNNTVIISQVNGSICYSGSFTGTLQIPVAHFAAGVYSISIMNTETGVWYTEKWVKML